jgi:quinol monooxygenase YgiN
MITVVALVRAKPGEAARVRSALEKLVVPTHAEAGNAVYVLNADADDPNLFIFFENWESRAAFDLHLQAPHMQGFASEAGDLLAGPLELHFLEPIAGQTR